MADTYNHYLERSREALAGATPVATTPAGQAADDIAVGVLDEDVDYWYALSVTSAAGVESEQTAPIRVRIEAGELLGQPPNAIAAESVRLTPLAGGSIRIDAAYDPTDQPAACSMIRVAALDAGGQPDWDSPEATIACAAAGPLTRAVRATLGPYADGQTVRLAVRAEAADGSASAATVLDAVVADAAAPPAPTYAEASQA